MRDPDPLGGKCGVRQFKTPGSGCRAWACGVTGDYLAEEPSRACEPETRTVSLWRPGACYNENKPAMPRVKSLRPGFSNDRRMRTW